MINNNSPLSCFQKFLTIDLFYLNVLAVLLAYISWLENYCVHTFIGSKPHIQARHFCVHTCSHIVWITQAELADIECLYILGCCILWWVSNFLFAMDLKFLYMVVILWILNIYLAASSVSSEILFIFAVD